MDEEPKLRRVERDLAVRQVQELEGRLRQIREARAQLDVAVSAAEHELGRLRWALDPAGRPPTRDESRDAAPVLDDVNVTKIPYLEAGVRLIAKAYGFKYLDGHRAEDAEDESVEDEMLAFITPKRVCDLVGAKSASTFYSLWPQTAGGRRRYVLELLAFIFGRPETFSPAWQEEPDLTGYLGEAIAAGSISAGIHRFAARNVDALLIGDPMWYLQLHLAAALQRDDEVGEMARRCLESGYRLALEHYIPEYEQFLRSRGLRPRDGVSVSDLAQILWALAEGLGLRYLAADERPDERQNLFGTAVLAIFAALIVPADDSGEPTIEQMVDAVAAASS